LDSIKQSFPVARAFTFNFPECGIPSLNPLPAADFTRRAAALRSNGLAFVFKSERKTFSKYPAIGAESIITPASRLSCHQLAKILAAHNDQWNQRQSLCCAHSIGAKCFAVRSTPLLLIFSAHFLHIEGLRAGNPPQVKNRLCLYRSFRVGLKDIKKLGFSNFYNKL
jgi:hypothetical protein